MSVQGRTWALWAHRYENGDLWHIGERPWVQLHGLSDPLVAVLVEEVLGDPYDLRVTHYGWQDVEDPADAAPVMIQIRTGSTPQRAMMFLSMCFPYGIKAAVTAGEGRVIALRITERQITPIPT